MRAKGLKEFPPRRNQREVATRRTVALLRCRPAALSKTASLNGGRGVGTLTVISLEELLKRFLTIVL